MLLALFTFGVAASSVSSARAVSPSPSAEVELICHTENEAECYPKIFQATDEFQIVHEDQDLPIGLHVRLNIQTGRREAKINVPDEIDPALEGLPVDTSIVIVDPEQLEEEAPAPNYDAAGPIKVPTEHSGAFHDALSYVRRGSNLDEALETMEEISHDIYYGLKISEEYETVKQLFCLANTGDIFSSVASEKVMSRAKLAALTLSSSLQNNPKALAEIEKHWERLHNVKCPGSDEPLSSATFRLVSPHSSNANNNPGLAKVRVAAINGLLKSPLIRKDFFSSNGPKFLLEVLAKGKSAEWEPAQTKVAFLLLDNFLDKNLGATLREWPLGAQETDSVCKRQAGASVTEDCFDWHVKNLASLYKAGHDHWSQELLRKLNQQRKANSGRTRSEL